MKQIFLAAALASAAFCGNAYAQSRPAGDAAAAAPAMMVDTPSFLKAVPSSNMFEIESSKMAQTKSTDADIKTFADQMIADHTKAGEELKATGKLPAGDPPLAPKHAAMLKQLQDADGKDFDMLYLDMQAGAHNEAVMIFDTYSKSGDDADVVAFAKKTLPTLEMHKMHVKELVAKK